MNKKQNTFFHCFLLCQLSATYGCYCYCGFCYYCNSLGETISVSHLLCTFPRRMWFPLCGGFVNVCLFAYSKLQEYLLLFISIILLRNMGLFCFPFFSTSLTKCNHKRTQTRQRMNINDYICQLKFNHYRITYKYVRLPNARHMLKSWIYIIFSFTRFFPCLFLLFPLPFFCCEKCFSFHNVVVAINTCA